MSMLTQPLHQRFSRNHVRSRSNRALARDLQAPDQYIPGNLPSGTWGTCQPRISREGKAHPIPSTSRFQLLSRSLLHSSFQLNYTILSSPSAPVLSVALASPTTGQTSSPAIQEAMHSAEVPGSNSCLHLAQHDQHTHGAMFLACMNMCVCVGLLLSTAGVSS